MCGRYALTAFSPEFGMVELPAGFAANRDARPTSRMPVVRRTGAGDWVCELRQWGFLRQWPGKSGTPVKRTLFNAISEEVTHKRTFKKAFAGARCIVPMNAWYEWREEEVGKQRYRIAMPQRPCFGAGGLVETSKDPDSGNAVRTFTLLTVAPGDNSPLKNVHERAPLVLQARDYAAWLDADWSLAQALIGPYPDQQAFSVEAVMPEIER